jgi:polysaccharide biosynthesis protein PslJ
VAAIEHVERVSPLAQQRRALAIFAFGILLFAASFAADRRAVFVGSIGLIACSVLAARETRAPVLTWRHSISAFVLLIWLMPIKTYRLPVDLPFKLELYRVLLGLLVVLMGYALLGRFRTSGRWIPTAARRSRSTTSSI